LLEGILEHKASYIGMLMMDKKTDLHTCFVQQKKLGVVNRFIGSYHADVRVRFIHMPPEIRQEFFDRPAYIPTYDNS